MKRLTISKSFVFEASHVLPKHPGKCSRLHGHSWKLTVAVSGPVNPATGFVVDYGQLGALVKAQIIDLCDHQHLGQGDVELCNCSTLNTHRSMRAVLGTTFYPSSENLVVAFARILGPLVQEFGASERIIYDNSGNSTFIPGAIQLEEVSLEETCTCKAIWRRDA